MRRPDAAFRLSVIGITLALLFSYPTPGSTAASEQEICNVNADFALGLEDYRTAIVLHRELLHAHNDNALAHYHLGFAYGMVGRTTEEIDEYLAAVRLGFNKWDLFLNLGLAYLDQNDSPKAIMALKAAVLLGPEHSETYFNLAIAYERSNSLDEALVEITSSVRLAPRDPDERNLRGIICAEVGDRVCARDEWVYLLQVAPDYTAARVNLAILTDSHLPSTASSSISLNRNRCAYER
jgi:Flp pilus assembly protein TadD